MDLAVLSKISYGLYIVGAFKSGKAVGCVINTCFQVTSQNPLMAISINKNNYTLEGIRENKRFSLSILCEDSDPAIIGRFGFYSSRDTDKYADFGYEVTAGTPCVNGKFAGRLLLEAEQLIDCETHMIVVARLVDTVKGEGIPMTYDFYHRVIKGTAPKNAPTYRGEETTAAEPKKEKRRYRCDICGYIVEREGDLPPDYKCPICNADRSHFIPIE